MFYIQSPMKRDFFVEELDGKTYNDVTYKHEKTEGMKVYFSYVGEVSLDEAVANAKAHLKTTDYGQSLYYLVMAVK